jgi:hypothetical protein
LKHKLQQDVGQAFADGKRYFNENPDIKSSELFHYAHSLAQKFGWEFGGPIAGDLIGQFPHERIADDKVTLYVHPDSDLTMRSLDEKGQKSGTGFWRFTLSTDSTKLVASTRSCSLEGEP